MSNTIIFYDIPSSNPKHKCWSPNTWKVRYTLNIKGLAYKTEWVEYPDIEALSKKLGVPPTSTRPDGRPLFTLLAIHDPTTNKSIVESAAIAKYLDETYPDTPTLFPAGTDVFQAAFLDGVWGAIGNPLFMHLIVAEGEILTPRSQTYFHEHNDAAFGAPLAELATAENWAALERGLEKLKGHLEANGAGRDMLFMGDRVTFSDIQVASLFTWAKVASGEDSTVWKKLTALHGGKWAKFMERFEAYEIVDA